MNPRRLIAAIGGVVDDVRDVLRNRAAANFIGKMTVKTLVQKAASKHSPGAEVQHDTEEQTR